ILARRELHERWLQLVLSCFVSGANRRSGVRESGLHGERSLRCNALRELEAAGVLLSVVDDLLHEPDAVSLGRVERVSRENPAHRVAPADRARKPYGGAAEWQDAAGHLDLPEYRRPRRHRDIAREDELDAEGEARALN